jgi:hypothetical protein
VTVRISFVRWIVGQVTFMGDITGYLDPQVYHPTLSIVFRYFVGRFVPLALVLLSMEVRLYPAGVLRSRSSR